MQARVRTAATIDAPVVGKLGPGQRVKVLAEEQGTPLDGEATWYRRTVAASPVAGCMGRP